MAHLPARPILASRGSVTFILLGVSPCQTAETSEEDGNVDPTSNEVGVAITLVSTTIVLVVWFLYYKASGTRRRMRGMLLRAGLDPSIETDADKKAVTKGIRQRCKKCQTEDVCERWLAHKITGDNYFCPNAEIFELLRERNIRTA